MFSEFREMPRDAGRNFVPAGLTYQNGIVHIEADRCRKSSIGSINNLKQSVATILLPISRSNPGLEVIKDDLAIRPDQNRLVFAWPAGTVFRSGSCTRSAINR